MIDCVFCKIATGEIKSNKIYENDNFFSIFDRSPVAPGHSLVISKKHFKTSLDLHDSLGDEFLDCLKNTALKVIDANNAEGFNVISNNFAAAGQVVNHFHFHIIPRKKGDGLNMIA
ncbi:HIT domain-containing protein [Candidatus Pacearchaeota archaeon]|nr:HIT domain-containing protein [Candidatus Pacearchaeota archaeon]